jgi:AraC-like DNA-binding protein
MRTPTGAEAHAVQWFARECQIAAGVFVDPADSIEALNAVYAAVSAAPEASAALMFPVALALVGLARSLLQWSRRCESSTDQSGKPSAHERSAQALDLVVVLHTRQSLTLRDIAAQLRIGDAHLCAVLKRTSGRGFLGHLHTIRVLHAIVLLAETDLTIKATARRCGYHHGPQLNRHFRKIVHTTPTRFRRRVNARARLCRNPQRTPG